MTSLCAGDDVAVAKKWRHRSWPSGILILNFSSSKPNFWVSIVTSELSGNNLLITTKKTVMTSRGCRPLSSQNHDISSSRLSSEFRLQCLLADVESFLTSDRDVAITSSAVWIWIAWCFYQLWSRFATPFLVRSHWIWLHKTQAVCEIPKPKKNLAKSCSSKRLFVFFAKGVFSLFSSFCLGLGLRLRLGLGLGLGLGWG